MARFYFRAHGPTESKRLQVSLCVTALALAPALAACVSYEPAPVDASEVLAGLEAWTWQASAGGEGAQPEGAGPGQIASFAVTYNPSLRAARAEIGVAEALLVEAGLLEDPDIGWDSMNVLASLIVDGAATPHDYVSGIGISWALPRPGELDAKKGAANWHIEETRLRLLQGEWLLARDVHVSCEDVLEAERLLAQNQELIGVAETTSDYFERAKVAGTATAIQANLAAGDLLAIRAQRVRLEARSRHARHQLNALLGLPPPTTIPVVAEVVAQDPLADETPQTPGLLVEQSLSLRPDLAALFASYQVAEEELHLEVTRQFPLITIGTVFAIVPGFFTRFNRPAIETAMARREVLGREIEAQIHEVRRDIHDAYASLEESLRELRFLESELLPNAEESLRLAGAAFDAGEVTLLEILIVQRALVDARTRTTEARAEFQRMHWRLLAASGELLVTSATEALEEGDQ